MIKRIILPKEKDILYAKIQKTDVQKIQVDENMVKYVFKPYCIVYDNSPRQELDTKTNSFFESKHKDKMILLYYLNSEIASLSWKSGDATPTHNYLYKIFKAAKEKANTQRQ